MDAVDSRELSECQTALRVIVADGTDSVFHSNERLLVYRNMGFGAVWNWRYCTQEIVSENLWVGGISAVMCLPLLKSIGITRIIHLRCRRSKNLKTRFPGIVYNEFVIDDTEEDDLETTRLRAVYEIVASIRNRKEKVLAYETVLREDTWVVVTLSTAILLATPILHVIGFLKLARAFNGMCRTDPRVVSDLCERRRQIGKYTRALLFIWRERKLPLDTIQTIALHLDKFFADNSVFPWIWINGAPRNVKTIDQM